MDAGANITSQYQKSGIISKTYYNWRLSFGEMRESDLRCASDLEDRNDHLKGIFANLSVIYHATEEPIKNSW